MLAGEEQTSMLADDDVDELKGANTLTGGVQWNFSFHPCPWSTMTMTRFQLFVSCFLSLVS